MTARRLLVTFAVVVALVGLNIALPPGTSAVVHTAVALPLVLFCPGFALMAALFPMRSRPSTSEESVGIDWPERLLFSVALSLVIAIVGGLLLNRTGPGLTTTSWALFLVGVTVIAGIPAVLRSMSGLATGLTPGSVSWTRFLVYGAAVLLAATALVVARSSAVQDQARPFTQLWILPGAGSTAAEIGIRSQESSTQDYLLRVVSGGQVIRQYALSLAPGMTWQRTVSVPSRQSGIAAYLYRPNHPGAPYRWVKLAPAQPG